MPQLNPAPWLLTLLFSWLVFLIIMPQKVSSHIFPNGPNTLNTTAFKNNMWNWPWL
uniref:ATP synthase complex subunit 8 n=1 Tax=Draconetta xenica TaxID=215391 RepID=A0A060P0L1_9TELE|nr:ATP synthase F0 subunit 8 [Draconetta xenica]BAO84684.1 ATPase subunit 8 [Draconetta xenica]